VDVIKRRLGGWQEALARAGLGERYVGPVITQQMKVQPGRAMGDDEILHRIRDVATKLGKAELSGAEVEANSEITYSQMYRRFGGVSQALKRAGVSQAKLGRRYTEAELFENVLNVWAHYERPPKVSEMDRPPSVIGANAYIKRYARWREALKVFVARANSEVEGISGLTSVEEPSQEADPNEPPQSPAANINDRATLRTTGSVLLPSRATPANVRPEDRRDPSIGLRFKVLQRDHFKCVLCGDHPARSAECVLQVDHVTPWSKGGKTREDNLRTLCATCNVGRVLPA
jgi:hypothetical protein